MKEKAAIWTAVLSAGALLAVLGATAASTSDSGSGIGMIVFGLVIVAVSLPFLLHYASKVPDERAGREREAKERAEVDAGARCGECCCRLPGEHALACSQYVHEPELVSTRGGEWLLSGGAYYPARTYYYVRCSCGYETAGHDTPGVAVAMYEDLHGYQVKHGLVISATARL